VNQVTVVGSIRKSVVISPELMQDEFGLDLSWGLGVVGDQASDEMRVCGVQHRHERVKRLPVYHSHGLEGLLSVLGSSGHAILEETGHEGHSGLSEEIETVLVEGIRVLGEPISNVVSDNTWQGMGQ